MVTERRLNASKLRHVLEKATVPEHSVPFMEAISGGTPFLAGPHLFIAAEDWLLAVGYPIDSEYDAAEFDGSLKEALRLTGAKDCWAIAPSLPQRLAAHRIELDHYHTLSTAADIPKRLLGYARKAASVLRVEEGRVFTPAHRRLWTEFTGRVSLPDTVRELYAKSEQVMATVPDLLLLNAWDQEGNLAACLLLDLAPRRFLTYLLGAHSRIHYTAHASDLLFHEMIQIARRQRKEFLHLGLGVNDGIRRFKIKWGGEPTLPYEMAAWHEKDHLRGHVHEMMRVLASMPVESMSRRQYLASLPKQRPFAMLWEIEADSRRSWIAGTAHFFCYSFESSLRRLFQEVDTVLFEGPLDRASLDLVSRIGHSPGPESQSLMDLMDPEDVRLLERVVEGPRGRWARLFGLESRNAPDVRFLLSKTRHWMAFFSIWTGFLARHGWCQSVDLEAWQLAQDMGRAVRGMETIEEQIETLESIPVARIVTFFRRCLEWKKYIKRHVRAYLKGDLQAMMGTSIEFPSRTELVINRRDARFIARMEPFLREGRCAVFVGSAHMLNLPRMLTDAGFRVRRCP